jgi:hypothetical protein
MTRSISAQQIQYVVFVARLLPPGQILPRRRHSLIEKVPRLRAKPIFESIEKSLAAYRMPGGFCFLGLFDQVRILCGVVFPIGINPIDDALYVVCCLVLDFPGNIRIAVAVYNGVDVHVRRELLRQFLAKAGHYVNDASRHVGRVQNLRKTDSTQRHLFRRQDDTGITADDYRCDI